MLLPYLLIGNHQVIFGLEQGNQGKKLKQIDPSINIYQLFEIDPSGFGVDSLAYIKNITTAYRKLSCVQHPDRHINSNDNKTANANFLIIKEAYDILLNPVKCQQYNDLNHISYGFPLLNPVKDQQYNVQLRMKKGMFITDVEQLDSYMKLLSKDQLHTVVHHSHRLRYEKLNIGDK